VHVAKVLTLDAENLGLYCVRELQVQPKPQSNVTRTLLEFSRIKNTKICEKLSIYNHLGNYSKEYIALCKDYYLNF
jgi:tRNA1Val (adenine37-N6)-methyltransferase